MSATVRELPAGLDLLALKRAAPSEFPLLLESAAQGGKARWDLLLAGGGSGLFLGADGVTRRESGHAVAGRFLDALDHAQSELRERLACIDASREGAGESPGDGGADLPFRGGWALYLGYELAGEIEPTLRLPPSRCIYVGDDRRDIDAGNAAGMPTLVASWGYLGNGDPPAEWPARGWLASPADLFRWLD